MSLYVKVVERAFPGTKHAVEKTDYLSTEEKSLLKKMGFGEYYVSNPQCDTLHLNIDSGTKALSKVAGQNIDFFMGQTCGNGRLYGDYPVASYLQSEIGLATCPGMMMDSMCTTLPMALTFFESLVMARPQYKNALVSCATGFFPPMASEVVAANLEKHRGIVFGAGSTSIVISTEKGPLRILATSLGACYIEGDSWNIPSGIFPFQYDENHKMTGQGHVKIAWNSGVRTPLQASGEYVSPAQIVMKQTIQMICEALKKHSVEEVKLSCMPIGNVLTDQIVQKACGNSVKIIKNDSIYERFGHVGACDPALVMYDALENGKPGFYCHLCIGQGYTGSFILFEVL